MYEKGYMHSNWSDLMWLIEISTWKNLPIVIHSFHCTWQNSLRQGTPRKKGENKGRKKGAKKESLVQNKKHTAHHMYIICKNQVPFSLFHFPFFSSFIFYLFLFTKLIFLLFFRFLSPHLLLPWILSLTIASAAAVAASLSFCLLLSFKYPDRKSVV